MIVDLKTAQEINQELTRSDILALENTIKAETNNNFRLNEFPHTITHIERDGKVHIVGNNYIQATDTVEIRDVPYLYGLYHVKEVGADYVQLDLDEPLRYDADNLNGRLYIVSFPRDVREGALNVLRYLAKKQQAPTESGVVRAKSVGRVRYEYATESDSVDLIYGAPKRLWAFLDPYRRLRWL